MSIRSKHTTQHIDVPSLFAAEPQLPPTLLRDKARKGVDSLSPVSFCLRFDHVAPCATPDLAPTPVWLCSPPLLSPRPRRTP